MTYSIEMLVQTLVNPAVCFRPEPITLEVRVHSVVENHITEMETEASM